ncbi:MAG: PASTA domain-containing protein, partial [Eggerthellaceae bacterium]|nr:PASTA domain-containing protein [Eggerthellaceae bacterium]
GTAHYISPEQVRGKDLTPASDIYSLGVVLYEAVTGFLPFDGPDAISVAMQQVTRPPLPPHSHRPDIDPSLEGIIMKALAKKATDRFATANDMCIALTDYLAGRPDDLGAGSSPTKNALVGGIAAAGTSQAAKAGGMMGGFPDHTAIMPTAIRPSAQNPPSRNYRASSSSKKNSKKETTRIVVGIVIGILAALLVIGGVIFFLLNQNPAGDSVSDTTDKSATVPDVTGQSATVPDVTGQSATVPDVTGISFAAATQELQDAGFDIGTTTEDYSASIATGLVISQDPKAGDPASAGTKVNLVVSKGLEQVPVPDLTGKSADDARKALDDAGLKSAAGTAEYSSTVPVNQVIRQDPPAGQTVNKGSTVTYYLSLGIENGDVPSVIGLSREGAIAALEAAGFKLGNEGHQFNTNNDNSKKGLVISQNPNAGTSTPKGTQVDIVIDDGVEQATVPDFTKTSMDQAQAVAVAAKIVLVQSGTAYSDSIPAGTVVSQDTPAGTKVDIWTTIGVVVSLGPETPTPTPPSGP